MKKSELKKTINEFHKTIKNKKHEKIRTKKNYTRV